LRAIVKVYPGRYAVTVPERDVERDPDDFDDWADLLQLGRLVDAEKAAERVECDEPGAND